MMTFTIDAAYPEQFGFSFGQMHTGYLFHDFGASVFSGQITWSWPSVSSGIINGSTTWLKSSGAATLGATVGEASSSSSAVTVPLNSAVASGRHLLVMVFMVLDPVITSTPGVANISITDTVGGNSIQYGSYPNIGFSYIGTSGPDGYGQHVWSDFYKITNSLSNTDSVTITLPNYSPRFLQARLHILNGIDSSDPIGPNSGGNLVGMGDGYFASSPKTRTAPPTPNWVGPTITTGMYRLDKAPGVYLSELLLRAAA